MLRRNACNRCYLCLRHDAREMRQIDYNNNNLQEVPAKVQDGILFRFFLIDCLVKCKTFLEADGANSE